MTIIGTCYIHEEGITDYWLTLTKRDNNSFKYSI